MKVIFKIIFFRLEGSFGVPLCAQTGNRFFRNAVETQIP